MSDERLAKIRERLRNGTSDTRDTQYLLEQYAQLMGQHVMDVDQIARLQGTIEGMSEGVEHLKKEIAFLKEGIASESWEIEQALGKALGFPWYKDDPKTFPDATEADGVCTGIDTPTTLAQLAAERIEKMRAALEAVEMVLHHNSATVWYECPWCYHERGEEHAPNCQRQAALGIKGE